MGKVSSFLYSSARLAAAIFFGCAALALSAWAYTSWNAHRQELRRLPLAAPKNWGTLDFVGDAKGELKTAWRDGTLFYQLDISGYSEDSISHQADASLTIEFNDTDGFKLFEQAVPIAAMSRMLGPDGKPAGLSWSEDHYIDPERYARATTASLLWRGVELRNLAGASEPKPKPVQAPQLQPPWRLRGNWRQLEVGLTEAVVRGLLGEPSQVTRFGSRLYKWRYGSVLDGGTVSFDQDGVTDWDEPSAW